MRDDNCITRGKCWKKNCSACPDGPTVQEEVHLTAEVQRGMRDRDTIVFEEVRKGFPMCADVFPREMGVSP